MIDLRINLDANAMSVLHEINGRLTALMHTNKRLEHDIEDLSMRVRRLSPHEHRQSTQERETQRAIDASTRQIQDVTTRMQAAIDAMHEHPMQPPTGAPGAV